MMVIYKVCEETPMDKKLEYIEKNGKHFSKNLCEWAVSLMDHNKGFITKTQLDNLMKKYNVTIDNNELFDYVFVGNMVKQDYYGSSIEDEHHLILCVKDIIDDIDEVEGHIFCKFCASMCNKNIEIDWNEMM